MPINSVIKCLTISLILLMVVFCVFSSGFYLVSFQVYPDAFFLLRNIGCGLLVLLISNLILLTLANALRSFVDDSVDDSGSND